MPESTIIQIPMPPGSGPQAGKHHKVKPFEQFSEPFAIGNTAEFAYYEDGHLFAYDPSGCFDPPMPASADRKKKEKGTTHLAVKAGTVIVIYIYNSGTDVDTLTITVS